MVVLERLLFVDIRAGQHGGLTNILGHEKLNSLSLRR